MYGKYYYYPAFFCLRCSFCFVVEEPQSKQMYGCITSTPLLLVHEANSYVCTQSAAVPVPSTCLALIHEPFRYTPLRYVD